MDHLQEFRRSYPDDDERFLRTYNRLRFGDHIRIINGNYYGTVGLIGYIHPGSPPNVTIITTQGDDIVCDFRHLQLVEDVASSDTEDSDEDDDDDEDDNNYYSPTIQPQLENDLLAHLSLQVTAMILMQPDPKRGWKKLKDATIDNLNARLWRPLFPGPPTTAPRAIPPTTTSSTEQ
jgi:hypothetical protein